MNAVNSRTRQPNTWDLFNDFDNVVTSLFRPLQGSAPTNANTNANKNTTRVPSVDITEAETSYVITADLPGVGKDNIEVSIEDGVLTLSAKVELKKEPSEPTSDVRVIRQERRQGKFERTMRLGDNVDEAGIQASYVDGVLTLTLPKAAKATPRKITVAAA